LASVSRSGTSRLPINAELLGELRRLTAPSVPVTGPIGPLRPSDGG
jgi:hypothetical protein